MLDRKEVFTMLAAAAPEAFRIAKEKGWWNDIDAPSKKAETVMLMVSELGEAINAHRDNQWFPGKINGRDLWKKENAAKVLDTATGDQFLDSYINFCKGTVEGELADVTIRLISYCAAYKQRLADPEFRKEGTKNFGHDLLKLNYWFLESYHGQVENMLHFKDWSYTLKAVIAFCDWWNIDIIPHVKWRLKYTELKPVDNERSY